MKAINIKDAIRTPKGWGEEIMLGNEKVYNARGFCGKILSFKKYRSKSSIHLHKDKVEFFFVLYGSFHLEIIDTYNAKIKLITLKEGDISPTIYPLTPHRLICLSDGGKIIEFSTFDCASDNYRILPGDSQK